MPSPVTGRARLRGLAIALLAAAAATLGLLGASLAGPSSVAGVGPLPACRYANVLTAPREYDDWPFTLVDTILEVPATYVPPELVAVSTAGIGGSGMVRAVAVADLRAMTAAAQAAGNPVAVQSAYRSYATQEATFDYWVSQDGYQTALLYSARPGHSEHQLGLAIDFKSAGAASPFDGDWGTTAAGAWMRLHAWQYGWIQSFPKNQQAKTCYAYEAWHFRYLGRPLAAKVHASGLTVREYLWTHFTTATAALPTKAPGTGEPAASAAHASARPDAGPDASVRPTGDSSGAAGTSLPASSQPTLSPVGPAATPSPAPAPAGATADPGSPPVVLALVAVVLALAVIVVLRARRGTVGEGLQQY
ncbi:MAG TPA: M15 family metallopeptidase [Candidatus Binatus sp.]|nr:M15 family metallopeptidase [Candidatus Binatus sp.]